MELPSTAPAAPPSVPPSPSAFPSLPTATAPTLDPPAPAPAPAPAQPGISYAKVSKSLLPPTSAPQGTSLPPPPHPPQHPKERLQVSQNGRDSPYARGSGKKKAPVSRLAKAAPSDHHLLPQPQPRGTHKVVPGMPPSMIPAPKKGAHSRTPSTSTSTPPPAPSAGAAADPAIPGIGKKRRQSLRKVLPPTASKLSPFAASFEFAPRAPHSHSASGSSADSSASAASSSDDNHGELLSTHEQADISATVASAGAQGDEFRAKSQSQADAEGEPAAADPSPSQQSARAEKPSAASAADEGASARQENKATLPADDARTDRPLGAFLTEAFAHADGSFAPLALPEVESPAEDKMQKQVTIPGAVQASPIADLSWREKRGWWHDEYDPSASAAPEAPSPSSHANGVDLAGAAPAAIEPAQAASYEPILRFPAWAPAASTDATAASRTVRESVAPEDVPPLSQFLGGAFSDAAEAGDLPLGAEGAARASAPAPAPAAGALASFLSGSFAPLPDEGAWATFGSLDERRADALAAAGPGALAADDMPMSAEAVAALPTLDDVLDVDVAGGEVVPEADAKKEAQEKRGWWSEGFDAAAAAGGGTLLSAQEQRDIAETVGSAGAQGDEFHAKSQSQVDVEGEAQSQPTAAGAQSAAPSKDAPGAEAAKSGAATPLGQYLGQAFSGELAAAPAPQPEAPTSSAPAPAPVSTLLSPPGPAPAQRSASPSRSPSRSRSPSPLPSDSPSRPAHAADSAPSLTLALASAWHTAPWSRKLWAVLASLAINVGLPFVNGVMLGFGELFARNVVGVRLGWPLASASASASSPGRANTAGVGLRAAGAAGARGRGADVPGHAGVKTAVEAAGEAVREAAE
ncbi:hypothetical protein JCM3770_000994 [Rhodotorula araucariae]